MKSILRAISGAGRPCHFQNGIYWLGTQTAYDGDWDAYIDDFATKIPDYLDVLNAGFEGWPGIRSPEAKDYLAKYQVTAEGWFVANDLTVAETRRLERNGKALDEFLDKISE